MKKKAKKQYKVTGIKNKEIAELTGYSYNYLKTIGKEKAIKLLKKTTQEDILKERIKVKVLEGVAFFSEMFKTLDLTAVDEEKKLYTALKFLEIMMKELK